MSVNLKKNEKALLAAYNDVLSDKSETNWAVFGYEGNTNDVKVVETGDGGLEEMVDELSGGKVMYAYLRVTDPNTQLPKNVLVNWTGEGVPPNRKGVCARHTADIARFFRGAHVTINARSEMDLDEDTVLEKVSKASGANFSFHKEKARPMPAAGPVGSVYKKANPRADINPESRDKFWDQQEKLEEQRLASEKRDAVEQRRREEQERRDREAQESVARDRVSQERAKRIDEQKRREREQQKREVEEREAALQSRLRQREGEVDAELERERQEGQKRRVQERSAVSSAVRQKMAGFEEKAQETPPPAPARPPKKVVKAPPPAPREPTPEPEPEPEPEPYQQEEAYPEEPEQQMYDDVEAAQQEPQYPEEPEQELYDDVHEVQQPPPPPQDEGDYAQEGDYEQEPEQEMYDDVHQMEEPDQPLYDDTESATAPGGGGGGDEGLCAKTIYDYEAADDTEISFDPDEIITNIEQIDEGWWRGVRQLDGSYGLFPANYVELV